MKTPTITQRAKAILIFSMLLLAFGGSLAAQSRTKDRVRKRTHRIFAAQTGPDQVTLAWDEVPGTTEYRIYLPDPNKPGPPEPGSQPWTALSGSGRRAVVMGVSRLSAGAYLEALGEGEGDVLYRGTFNSVARAPLAPPKAPAAVQARESGETEVTLSWTPVPGATAYMINRAVGGSGWQMLCDVCPPEGEFVDDTATPGLAHTYSVAAIFPLGISTRTSSKTLTVGAAQLAAATASAPQPAVWDKPMSTGTPVAGTEGDNTNVGASAGTPTTGMTTTGTTTTGTGTTTPSTGSTSNPCTPVVVPKTGTATIYTKPMSTGTPVAGTEGDNTNAGASAGITTTGSTPGCTPGTGTGTNTGTGTGTTTGWTPGGVPAGSGTTTSYPTGGMPSGNPGSWGTPTNTFTPPGTPAQQLPTTTTQTTIHTATPITTTQPTTVHTATPISTQTPTDPMHPVLEMVGQIQQMLGSITGSVGTQINQTTLTTFGQIKDIAGAIANTLGTQMMQPTTTTHTATPVTATTATQTTTDPMHRVLEMIGQMQQMLGSITGSVGTKMSLGTVSTIGQIKDIAGTIANTLGTQVMQPTTTTHAATPVTATAPGLP